MTRVIYTNIQVMSLDGRVLEAFRIFFFKLLQRGDKIKLLNHEIQDS